MVSVDRTHMRHCLLYCFDRGISATEAYEELLLTYKDEALPRAQCYKWFNKFKAGNRKLDDEERSGRPTVVNDDELKLAIEEDPRATTQELAERFGVNHSTIATHLHDIGKVYKAGRWVPHSLTDMNKFDRLLYSYEILRRAKTSGFWDTILISDKKWIVYDNVVRKRQWLNPGEAPEPTPKPPVHQKKVMLCIWWNSRGPVYWELLDPGQTVNQEVYITQLDEVKKVLDKQGEDHSKIHYIQDNARPHIAKLTLAKLHEIGWKVLPHPPYSPDLAPTDYHLFRSMASALKEKKFKNVEEIKKWVSSFLHGKQQDFYCDGIKHLRKRCQEVIDANGEYGEH